MSSTDATPSNTPQATEPAKEPQAPATDSSHTPQAPAPGLSHEPQAPATGLSHEPQAPETGFSHTPQATDPANEPRAPATGSSSPNDGTVQLPVLNDSDLTAQGWQRRHTIDAARAAESVEIYKSLGFEVRIEQTDAAQFGSHCAPCAVAGAGSLVTIYTREKPPA